MLMCVHSMFESAHFSLRIEPPNMNLIFFHNPLPGGFYLEIDIQENNHHARPFQKLLWSKAMHFHIVM